MVNYRNLDFDSPISKCASRWKSFLPLHPPELAHLRLPVFSHEDETIPRPRRRRRHPNGVQHSPPRTSTGEEHNDNVGHVVGQQFVEYFTTRRPNEGARWCIFLCWEESHGNLVKTVDVPLPSDELKDEKKVFERLRLTYDQQRGFFRRSLYASIPEQAKIHPLGAPNLGDCSFTSLLQRFDPDKTRSDILNEIALINDSLPGNQINCYPVDSEPGHFYHLDDCLSHVGEDCPYQNLDSLQSQLLDVESVPFILARLFSDPQLATGQNILRRVMDSSPYSTYFYLYECLDPARFYRGFGYWELQAIYIREERKTFRITAAIIVCSFLLALIGKKVFNSWEAGIGASSLYISIVVFWFIFRN